MSSRAPLRLRKRSWAALLTCVFLVAPAGIVGLATPAGAVVPGSNGKIAYATPSGRIRVMNPDGSGAVDVNTGAVAADSPTWGPDGTKLAFVGSTNSWATSEIYVSNVDGSALTQLTHDGAVNDDPAWSPDGTKIVFDTTSATDPNAATEIHVVSSDGSAQAAVTHGAAGDASEPAWSPDGTSIAYVAAGPAANSGTYNQIWRMSADGSAPHQLTTGTAGHFAPSWSPDGARIAFTSVVAGAGSSIRTCDVNGASPATVTTGRDGVDDEPSWSPDGHFILFERTNAGILMANTDGSNAQALSADQGGNPDWASLNVNTAPGAPTGVTASPGDRSATVSWTAPARDGGSAITKYTVKTKGPTGSYSTKDVTSGTSTTITGLGNGTQYTITVTATNATGTGPASSPPVSVTPVAPPPPGPPTDVQATPGDGVATVSWTAPASNSGSAISKYTVTAQPSSGAAVTKDVRTTSTTIGGLTNGTQYSVTVTATNSGGTGAASTPVVVTPGNPAKAPGPPVGVSAVPGDSSASISWTAPASDGGAVILDYLVRASTGETAIANASPFPMTGLVNNVSRTFTVKARNSAGYGPESARSNAVIFHPEGVTSLSIARLPSSILPGRPIDVSGRLQGGDVANKRITVTVRAYHVAPKAYATYTDASGGWRLRFHPYVNATYTASFAGYGAQQPATSPTARNDVHALVTLDGSVTRRGLATLVGAVSPNAAGRLVYLVEVRSGGDLVVARGTIQRDGSYRMQHAFGSRQPTIRVRVDAFPGNLNGASGTRVV